MVLQDCPINQDSQTLKNWLKTLHTKKDISQKKRHMNSQWLKSLLPVWETLIKGTMRHTIHPWELWKLKRPPPSKFDEDMEQLTHTDESAKWYNHFGKNLAVSYKVKHILTVKPRNSTAMCLPKKNKNICPQKDLYKNVLSRLIYKTPDTYQQNGNIVSCGIFIHNGLTSTVKRNELLIRMNLKSTLLSETNFTHKKAHVVLF